MDKTTLVDKDKETGRTLIQALDEAGFGVRAALWLYFSEAEVWRLVIATERVDQEGPRWAYSFIQDVLSRLPIKKDISLNDISVVSPETELIKALRRVMPVDRDVDGIQISRNSIDNIYIEGAYIYRLQSPVGPSEERRTVANQRLS